MPQSLSTSPRNRGRKKTSSGKTTKSKRKVSGKSRNQGKTNQRRRTQAERTEEFSVHGIGEREQLRVRRGDRKRIKEVEKRGKSTLLQVDLPSMAARSLKLRKWRGRLGWFFAILCLSLLAIGVANLWLRQVLFAPSQAVAWHMRMQSDGWREASWVAKELGFEQGKPNLLDLNLAELDARLEADPGVIEAVLTRSLVGSEGGESVLRVELRERHPVAWLEVPSRGLRPMSSVHGMLLDAEGFGWRPRELRPAWASLPVIEASRLQQVPEEQKTEFNALLGAVALLELLSQPEFVQRGLQAQRARVIWEGDVGMGLEPFRLEVETVAKQQLLFSLDEQLSGTLLQQCERLLLVDARLAERGASFRRLNLCLPHELPGELVASTELNLPYLQRVENASLTQAKQVIEPELTNSSQAEVELQAGAQVQEVEWEVVNTQEYAGETLQNATEQEASIPAVGGFAADFEDDLEAVLQSQREY